MGDKTQYRHHTPIRDIKNRDRNLKNSDRDFKNSVRDLQNSDRDLKNSDKYLKMIDRDLKNSERDLKKRCTDFNTVTDIREEQQALRYEAVKKAAGGRRMSDNLSGLRELRRERRRLSDYEGCVGRNMNICERDYCGSFSQHTKYSEITGLGNNFGKTKIDKRLIFKAFRPNSVPSIYSFLHVHVTMLLHLHEPLVYKIIKKKC